jgi:hypothetical protein
MVTPHLPSAGYVDASYFATGQKLVEPKISKNNDDNEEIRTLALKEHGISNPAP